MGYDRTAPGAPGRTLEEGLELQRRLPRLGARLPGVSGRVVDYLRFATEHGGQQEEQSETDPDAPGSTRSAASEICLAPALSLSPGSEMTSFPDTPL